MRISGHDYRLPRWYFVSPVTWERQCLFGRVEGGRMHPNEAGRIVSEEWYRTAELRSNVHLDASIVMPNHFHGIVRLLEVDRPGSSRLSPPRPSVDQRSFGTSVPNSLSTIIGAMKAAVTRRTRRLEGWEGRRIWQPKFQDRIIRSRQELERARRYIQANPQNWKGCPDCDCEV
jgi:REP element-mobilizing transposase RayT